MNDKKFFDLVRDSVFGGRISEEQFEGTVKILDYRDQKWPRMIDAELAFVLATAFWESGRTMQPIEEGQPTLRGERLKAYQKKLRYYPAYGRGLVQTTHPENYARLGLNKPEDYHKALEWDYALRFLFEGMIFGWFRKDKAGVPHKLSRYITEKRQDWINARLIVNGIPKGQKLPDRAVEIAGYAKAFHAALLKAADAPMIEKSAPATPIAASAAPTIWDRISEALDKLGAQPAVPTPRSALPPSEVEAKPAQSELITRAERMEKGLIEMNATLQEIRAELAMLNASVAPLVALVKELQAERAAAQPKLDALKAEIVAAKDAVASATAPAA